MLAEVESRFKTAQEALDQASITEEKAKKTAEIAAHSAAEANKTAEAAATAAAEQKAAVDALKAQEDAYASKTLDLQAKASEAVGVSGMRAKNELAQHLNEDPLPLRKAKLTAEAAAKKTDKANQVAQVAKEAADKDHASAKAAAQAAEKDKITAEEAVKEGEKALADAEAFLEEQKAKGSGETPQGTLWWMDRELAFRKQFMPKTGTAKLIF